MGFAVANRFLGLLFVLGAFVPAYSQGTLPAGDQALVTNSWGFSCLKNTSCGNDGVWIPTVSQPGVVRLWNSGTNWVDLQTARGTYDWTNLDTYLDMLEGHPGTAVLYTFGQTPCFIASVACGTNFYSPSPPSDLTASGSPTFTAFVTALVQHCSPAGNCVRQYIQNWEMWNEANLPSFWTGSTLQLYQMFAPVIAIIRANIPGAVVMTPPVCGGDANWMASWMTQENTYGKLSDYYSIHIYMRDYPPEQRLSMLSKMVSTKNTNAWPTTPWINSETNYNNFTFTCNPQFTVEDCEGQIVRWHVLQFAYQGGAGGAAFIGWYNWPSIDNGGYDTYYYTMMQWLRGATFTASCTNVGTVWSCPLAEPAGGSALIVWDTAGNSSYTPASQYVDYHEFNGTYGGASVAISPGQTTTIGVIPVMFETLKLRPKKF